MTGYGECAPLPEAGTETFEQAGAVLKTICSDCGGGSVASAAARLEGLSATPAVRCALETALLDLCAQQSAMPLSRWLARDAVDRVSVNAACGCLDAAFDTRLGEALGQGFGVIKIKLGVYPLEQELACLQRLDLPAGVELRLDANRAWSFEQALHAVEVCGRLPVESLEEPLRAPDPATLGRVQQAAAFPLALDESLVDIFAATPADVLPVKRLVLKPAVLGGPSAVMKLARCAQQAGIESVVTSALETSVGLWAAVHVAAALGTHLSHGLGTAAWFEDPDPVVYPLQGVANIRLPEGYGLPTPSW